MSIVAQSDENTVTLVGSLTTVTVPANITIADTSRAEIIFDVRTAQSVLQVPDYAITGRVFNDVGVTKVEFKRGGNNGTLVVHYILKEYTIASGVVVNRGEATMISNPLNITIPSTPMANTYARVNMRTVTFSSMTEIMLTVKLTSNTNIQLQGPVTQSGNRISWQTVYIPDQTVHIVEATATGTSFNVDITSLGILKDNTFCLQSMRASGVGIDADEIKGAELTSDTNLNIYSHVNETHISITQLVHRPLNKVQRFLASYTSVPFTLITGVPFVILDTFVQMCVPYQYFIPTNDITNNSQEFATTLIVNSTTEIQLQNFIGGKTKKVIVEIVELDAADPPVPTTAIKWSYYTMMNRRRR